MTDVSLYYTKLFNTGSEGAYPITIDCVSNGSTIYASQNLVLTVGTSPEIISPSATSFAVDEAGAFTITTDGIPTSALTETGALPPGTSFTDNGDGTATISGSPTQSGSFPVTISATNGLGSENQALVVSVGAVQPPEITSDSSATVNAGEASFFQVAATGAPPPVFSIASGSLPPGLTLSGNGLISGTTTDLGVYPITVEASNGVAPDDTQSLVVDAVGNQGFTDGANTSTTYSGGPPLSIAVEASGNPLPSITAVGLPPGVSIVDNGAVPGSPYLSSATISGTPTEQGEFQATLIDSNSLGIQTTMFVITFAEPSEITPASLPDAVVGTPYSQQFTATGDSGSLTWEGVSLPKGFALSPTGLLTGTPTTVGSFDVVVRVSSDNGGELTAWLTLNVDEVPLFGTKSPTSATFDEGVMGSATLTATGYPAPTFSEVGGLPSGVTLNSTTGVLSGIPAITVNSASYAITITAANGIAPSASEVFTLTVYAPLTITTSTLPGATRGTAYDGTGLQLQATGGIAPYEWKKIGTLPKGLMLSSSGVLSGIPSTTVPAGPYSIVVKVTVKEGKTSVTATRTLTLQIS